MGQAFSKHLVRQNVYAMFPTDFREYQHSKRVQTEQGFSLGHGSYWRRQNGISLSRNVCKTIFLHKQIRVFRLMFEDLEAQ